MSELLNQTGLTLGTLIKVKVTATNEIGSGTYSSLNTAG
jgi:hypothetical protein